MGKRIAIAAIGTHGDIQPFVALALGLKARGHSVVIGAPGDYDDFISGHGIDFCNIVDDLQGFVSQGTFDQVMSKGALIYAPQLLRDGQRMLKEAGRRTWEMVQGADLLIFHMNTTFCIDMAEALDVPAVMTAFQPLNPTGEFPYFGYEDIAAEPRPRRRPQRAPKILRTRVRRSSGFSLDPLMNKLTYIVQIAQQSYYDLPRDPLRQKLLGLKPKKRGGFERNSRGEQLLSLHAYSPTLSPRPKDWPDRVIVTGFWKLPETSFRQPDPGFRAFLDAGEQPLYLGFGSMPWGAQRNTELIREALRLWGGRAVIGKGWGGVIAGELPPTVYSIDRAPHSELFKYVRGVVHHGGAGTTHTGLELGRPTLVIPQFFDQPYWGKRVAALGCGPPPVRLRKLTAPGLASLLKELSSNPSYAAAAAEIARKLAAEDGVGRAAEVIEAAMVLHPARSRTMPDMPEVAS